MQTDRNSRRFLLGCVAFGVALFVGLWHLPSVLNVAGILLGMVSFFIIGLCIAFILNVPMRMIETKLFAPLNRRLGKRWRRARRPLSLVLTLLLVALLIALTVFMVVPSMTRTVLLLAEETPGFLARAQAWLEGLPFLQGQALPDWLDSDAIDWESIVDAAIQLLRNGAGSFLKGTFSAATSIVSGTFNFSVGIILALYILAAKERLGNQVTRTLMAFLPARGAERVLHIGHTADRVFSAFLSGQFLEGVILGLLFFIGMTILRFPFAPMVSLLVGVTSLIPIFGAFIGCIVGAFMILVHEGFMTMVWFVVFFVILQQLEGDLIYPHVVGKSIMLPGLWVLVAVTLGGNLAGILGMLVAVPMAALLYTLLREVVDRRNAVREAADAL